MMVVRNTEYVFLGLVDIPKVGPRYLFEHERLGDLKALKVAKYVDVAADVVYFFDVNKGVSVGSGWRNRVNYESLPPYQRVV